MKYAYLLKVEAIANNNKYYKMTANGDGTFSAEFGRVGQTPQKASYPMSKWRIKYNEKLSAKKGYTDVTEMMTTTESKDANLTGNPKTDAVLMFLLQASKSDYSKTYSVSGSGITELQVAEAQKVLNQIVSATTLEEAQSLYVRLFTIIPRVMSNVRDYLPKNLERALEMHKHEQDKLDNANVQKSFVSSSDEKLLDMLGVEIVPCDLTSELQVLLDTNHTKAQNIFQLTKPSTQEKFDEFVFNASNKATRLLWHGTSVENVLSICKSSLLVRPTVVANGSMLSTKDGGIYQSDAFDKSYNYTRGNRKFMFVFHTHVGNELVCDKQSMIRQYSLAELIGMGKDSVYAPAGVNTGWGNLRNSERVIFRAEQTTMKYLIEVK